MVHSNAKCRGILLCCAALWLLVNAVYVTWEARVPRAEIFRFKEAGTSLALEGKFIASTPEVPFVYYAPLYPYFYGLWSKAAGIGLKQSILFDNLIRLLRTILIIAFIYPWLKQRLNFLNSKGVIAAFFCLMTTFLPSNADRPEELGLVFGLGAWLFLSTKVIPFSNLVFAAMLTAFSACASPASGILFFVSSLAMLYHEKRGRRSFEVFVATWLATIFVVLAPGIFSSPEHFQPFAKQILGGLISFRWLTEFNASFFAGMQKWYILRAILISGVAYVLWKRRSIDKKNDPVTVVLWASLISVPATLIFFNSDPKLVNVPTVTLFVACLYLWLREERLGSSIPIALALTVAFLPNVWRETVIIARAASVGSTYLSQPIRERVLSSVEENASLAVTSDQYFTFRGHRKIAQIQKVCDHLENFDYIYVTPYHKDTMGDAEPDPCSDKSKCFTVVEDLRDGETLRFFGIPTRYIVNTNGGVLLKNTECAPSTVATSHKD